MLSSTPSRQTRSKSRRRPSGKAVREKGGKTGSPPSGLTRFVPYLILTILALFFFWNLITPFASLRNWLWEDFLYQNYPYRVFAATSLARGMFPFWNPYVFAGQPFFADIQTAVLYPFNLVQAIFVSHDSLSPYLVQSIELLHYLLAAVFTFSFLRTCRLDSGASLLGAVTFAFSGFMVTHVLHMNFIYVFTWLPLVLLALEKALSGGGFRYALICSIFLALSNMGGYPQYSLYIYYTLALYWLVFELSRMKSGEWSPKEAFGRLFILGFITLTALGLNAFAYLPAAELADYTSRSSMTYEASVEHSFKPLFLIKLICPCFFGTQYPGMNSYWAGGYSAFWETCLFVGVLPLILALWALRAAGGNRHVQFAALLAGVCLWLALGKYGLLYKLFFNVAPGFDRFRIPGRFSALVSFALAILAAHGWYMLADLNGRMRKRYLSSGVLRVSAAVLGCSLILVLSLKTGVLASLEGGALASVKFNSAAMQACIASVAWASGAAVLIAVTGSISRVREKGLVIAAIMFVFAELYIFGAPFLKGDISPAELYPRDKLVQGFQHRGETGLFRINARSFKHPGIMALRRNQGSIHRLFLIEGYNPLQLKRKLGEIEDIDRRLDMLNVTYRIEVDLERRSAGLVPNPGYLPRAFMVHSWRVMEDEKEILSTLNSAEFDPRSEVILEKSPGIDMPEPGGHIDSRVEITEYSQNEIIVTTQSPAPGILVLSEWYYPAWKVWVDGKRVETLRADHALRSVACDRGTHKIRIAYSSDTFRVGVGVSLFTALCMLGVSLAMARRGKF